MKKNSIAKIVAFLALFGIVIGIIGTGILIIFSGNNTENNDTAISQKDLQKIINNSTLSNSLTGEQDTLTGTNNK